MKQILVGLAIAVLALGGVATRSEAQRAAFERTDQFASRGGSRETAVAAETDDYHDAILDISARKRAIETEYQAQLERSQGDFAANKRARDQRDAALANLRVQELYVRKEHDDNVDRINRYWDRGRSDLGRTNKIDSRDGKSYTEKVPKPALQYIYPSRLNRGNPEVRLPNGRWVPADMTRDRRLVPRNR